MPSTVLIRGGGEMATGVAVALHRAGFRIVLAETPQPRAIRRTVAFAEAVYQHSCTVEGLTASLCDTSEVDSVWQDGDIPIVVDPNANL
jgi:xanthine dehydrogenase accessory factor